MEQSSLIGVATVDITPGATTYTIGETATNIAKMTNTQTLVFAGTASINAVPTGLHRNGYAWPLIIPAAAMLL
jgi:hypothetical protein